MQVFIAWSGPRSKGVAEATSEWLRNVIQPVDPWLSEDAPSGSTWPVLTREKLSAAKFGILCVTPENADAPWLTFEAGALSANLGVSGVTPLLIDMSPNDLVGPLEQFQAATISQGKMKLLAQTINNLLGKHKLAPDVLTNSLTANWRAFNKNVEMARTIPLESNTVRTVIKTLRQHGLPRPSEGRWLNFDGGFESNSLYDAMFSLARKRLYIFGRKNRKAFDREHDEFFQRLPAKIAKGFDFRCL